MPALGPRVLLIEGALRDNGGLRVSRDLARRWQDLGARVRFLVLENVEPDGPMYEPDPRLALRTQYAMLVLMIGYTCGGLVLLLLGLRAIWAVFGA